MSKTRSPLDLARRWTAGVLLATTLGAGAVGVHLATEQGTTTASSTGSTSSSDTSASDSSASDSNSSSFGAVAGVSSGSGSSQTSTSGS